ncbi:MAG: thioredoxin domain-containing protein [Bacteroidota bacterium]|nr:thioredoxin domain-containing protein [Bacteroidota bacterium]
MKKHSPEYTNALINETSPYLLQHAHNPVNWYPWNEETLEKAKKEDKLILVSIGYSACHWCHVMEHESFEDKKVAQIMNDHFICIKVDREERPDIDQVYMLAVQLMTGHGGWPLNCFALPDGRPVYGGTYFPKQQWINILLNLTDLYSNDRNKVLDYAVQLTEGVKMAEIIKVNEAEESFTMDILDSSYQDWKMRLDQVEGGPDKAPKFPLPNNYQFLLRYAHLTKNEPLMKHVSLTLKKMAYGGIYDQIGGGFSRYSVDHLWKVPHFEKMMYDNAQLISLYSEAFRQSKDPLYKQVVTDTLEFIKRELTSPEGAFFSALDADSEGEEGKFYVWTKEELQTILKDRFGLFSDYFNINERGFWEHGNYILLRHEDDQTIADKHSISLNELQDIISGIKKELLDFREKRVRPGLDDKTLTSWNALMIQGYADAYRTFGEKEWLNAAEKNAAFLLSKQLRADGGLNHNYKNGRSTINGYLEDYCFTIEALIALYEVTFRESYLENAESLLKYSIAHFMDPSSGMFFFTSDEDKALISRKMELSDNVIPASNSAMAKVLFLLGTHLENPEYIGMSRKMLHNILPEIVPYGAGYSNWSMLLLHFAAPFKELAIVGKSVDEKRAELSQHYLPNVIFAGTSTLSTLPLLKNRTVEGQTYFYVCSEKTCQQPVSTTEEALRQLLA